MAAPGGTGLIGPFPPGVDEDGRDAYDKLRRRVLWSLPYGLYVVGSVSADRSRRNAMTLNWLTQVSFEPKLLAISVEQSALTHELVADAQAYTVNTVSRDDRAIVRKFTKPVEVDVATSTLNGFAYHDGPVTGAPVLDQAVAFVECAVREAVSCGGHTLFIGEIVNAGFQQDEDTPVLRMEDTRMSYGG
jgi:flavin reductase (DIM6/NTAB) family NADH-FMN oxidoreductase RutF